MQTILIATTNRGKLREVRAILDHLPVHFTTLANYPNLPEPIEDAVTFEGNAKLKALHYARLTGCWTLADDSGLEVDASVGSREHIQPGTRVRSVMSPPITPRSSRSSLGSHRSSGQPGSAVQSHWQARRRWWPRRRARWRG